MSVDRRSEKITEETFLEIFLILSAKLKPEDLAPLKGTVHPTIVASQISSRCRWIVLRHPPLWRKLIVHSLHKDPSAYASMWLERSKHLSLEIFVTTVFPVIAGLTVREVVNPQATRVGKKLRDTLAPHFGRFMTFSLVAASPGDIMFFLEAPGIKSAQLLENLSVNTKELPYEQVLYLGQTDAGTSPLFPPTPSLRKVRVTKTIPARSFLSHIFSGLEDLYLEGPEVTYLDGGGVALDIVKALSACPDLRKLTLQGTFGLPPIFDPEAAQPQVITFPKLTSIFIGPTCHNTGWLATMTAPKLEEFTLFEAYHASDEETYNHNWAISWNPVRDFLIRSAPPLWKLGLFDIGGQETGRVKLWACLKVLKEVRELWVKHADLGPASIFRSLGKMTPAGSGEYICPKLEKIVLTSYNEEDFVSLRQLRLARPSITAVERRGIH
jgi:hypothetical protein